MSKTHVWLLHQDSPAPGESGLKTLLKKQLNDPIILPKSVFRWFLAWLLYRKRSKTLPILEAPCPSKEQAQEQAEELNRLLGSDYCCHVLRRYDDSQEHVYKSTPSGATVVIAPMHPLRSALLYSALASARTALNRKKATSTEIKPMQYAAEYSETLASRIRERIIALNKRNGYAILFLLPQEPERKTSVEYKEDVLSLVKHIMNALGVDRPHHASFKTPPQHRVFQVWQKQGIDCVITCPLGWTTDNGELRNLQQQTVQRSNGMRIEHAQPIATHGEFMRLMVNRITSAETLLKSEESA